MRDDIEMWAREMKAACVTMPEKKKNPRLTKEKNVDINNDLYSEILVIF